MIKLAETAMSTLGRRKKEVGENNSAVHVPQCVRSKSENMLVRGLETSSHFDPDYNLITTLMTFLQTLNKNKLYLS